MYFQVWNSACFLVQLIVVIGCRSYLQTVKYRAALLVTTLGCQYGIYCITLKFRALSDSIYNCIPLLLSVSNVLLVNISDAGYYSLSSRYWKYDFLFAKMSLKAVDILNRLYSQPVSMYLVLYKNTWPKDCQKLNELTKYSYVCTVYVILPNSILLNLINIPKIIGKFHRWTNFQLKESCNQKCTKSAKHASKLSHKL